MSGQQAAGQSSFGTLGGPQYGIGGAPGPSGTGYGSGSDATNAAMMQQQTPGMSGFGAAGGPNMGMQQALQALQQPGLRGGNVLQGAPQMPQMGQFPPRQAMGGPMGAPMIDPTSAGGNFAPQGPWANYRARIQGQ